MTRWGVSLTKPTVCAAALRIDCPAAMNCARCFGFQADAGTDRSRSFQSPWPLFANSLLIAAHAVQLGSSVITATGPVSRALATAAVSCPAPLSDPPFGPPEPPSPKSNTAATIVANTATAATPPMAHLRFLLSFGPSVLDVTMDQLK